METNACLAQHIVYFPGDQLSRWKSSLLPMSVPLFFIPPFLLVCRLAVVIRTCVARLDRSISLSFSHTILPDQKRFLRNSTFSKDANHKRPFIYSILKNRDKIKKTKTKTKTKSGI